MSHLWNDSKSEVNMTCLIIERDTNESQPFFSSSACLLFVAFTAVGINTFWRKSFILSRDLSMIITSEILAIAILLGFHSGLDFSWEQIFFCGIAMAFTLGIHLYYWMTDGNKIKRPRNGLDVQDFINFVCTATTILSLVYQNSLPLANAEFDRTSDNMMKLWASIPILSLFQITRYVLSIFYFYYIIKEVEII